MELDEAVKLFSAGEEIRFDVRLEIYVVLALVAVAALVLTFLYCLDRQDQKRGTRRLLEEQQDPQHRRKSRTDTDGNEQAANKEKAD